jgi:hypothetical protein
MNMYFARRQSSHGIRHVLRESFRDSGLLRHRDLFDLGDDPGRFLVYPGGNAFYVSEEVEDRLRDLGVEFTAQGLEELFFPFVEPELRHKMAAFFHRGKGGGRRPMSLEEEGAVAAQHLFDKRRLYYLRYGNIDQSNIFGLPARLFRPLINKSRDELEQFFIAEERVLEGGQVKEYLYVIFNLQQYFNEMIARILPEGLDPLKMDEVFLKELCRLNDDDGFWAGFDRSDILPPYLARFVWLFFDSGFPSQRAEQEFIRQFMGGHRQFRWPEKKPATSDARLAELFGADGASLRKMNKRELTKLFREKAHEHHPDKGGEHDYFVELAAVYNELLQGKK